MASSRRIITSSHSSSFGFPLVKPLQKYFGGMKHFPIINHEEPSDQSHISAVFVFSPLSKSFDGSPLNLSRISDYKWCYNVKGFDGGQHIANFSAIDGMIYAFHQTLCDGVLIGARNLCYAQNFNFMPYSSSQFEHIRPLEPDLCQILFDQNQILRENGLIYRKYPAVVVTSQSGKEMMNHNGQMIDFLDCEVFKHINPFTNEYNDIYIITSIDGAEQIKKRWKKYKHLKERDIENVLIVLSDEERPNLIKTELIGNVLFAEPYNLKYITCEGGIVLMEKLMECKLINQLNFTLMKDSISNRMDGTNDDKFECIDIGWKPVMGFDYDRESFVIFDALSKT